MASSVLGKRTRGSAEPGSIALSPKIRKVTNSTLSASKLSQSQAKRQARAEDFNNENENPFVTRPSRNVFQDGNSMDLDELSESDLAKHVHQIPLSQSKNKATLQIPTPHTPRHRDALSKDPMTPRHRVIVSGKPLTPRTPRTPMTPGGSITTVYSKARQLFTRSSEPGRLVGRETEREELSSFVQNCIQKTTGGCTYVSGPPGTGKSAMVHEVTESFEESANVKKAYINCMSMKTSNDLYANLLDTFCDGVEVLEGEEITTLQGMFAPRRKSRTVYIVTLDEIDHILTMDLESLYKLFEWSLQKSSHLILVGIANALDLTDRFLPRLKARNLKPELLPFLPYNASQIKNVIITRLKSLVPVNSPTPDYVPFMHPAAIELCSRKVSSQTGDLRKAFDICRKAIDVIEAETRIKHEQALQDLILQETPSKKPLGENNNFASAGRKVVPAKSLAQSLATLTVETAPRATIAHVNKITSSTFGNGTNSRLRTLNLQQKAALCALVALEKRKREAAANLMATPSKTRNSAPTIKALYDVYCMLCKRDSVLHPLTSTEFRDVVGSLETLSLISAVDGRNGSFIGSGTPSKKGRKVFGSGVGIGDEKRVASFVGEREVLDAVEGVGAGILKGILSGEGLE